MWRKEVYVSWVTQYVFWVMLCQEMKEQVKTMYESYLKKEKEEDYEV